MKGVILAGGTGSRLRPLTYTMPKQMIPIANKPVLAYAVEDMTAAGIDEIGIVLGNQGGDEIREYFGNGEAFNADITYIHQGDPIGLAHAVDCCRDFVGEEPFVLYLGDDMIQNGITSFVRQFDPATHAGAIGVQSVGEPSRYGIVDTDGSDKVLGVYEKPDDPPTNLAAIGIFILNSTIFDAIEDLEPSDRGELELSDAIDDLLSEGRRFQSYRFDGWWRDVGTPADVLETNHLVLEDLSSQRRGTIKEGADVTGPVSLGAGAVIESGATIRGPASIGTNTTIGSRCSVGPFTTVGRDCSVDRCHIEESVVLSGAEILCDERFMESIVGRDVSLSDAPNSSNDVNLVLGADASIRF